MKQCYIEKKFSAANAALVTTIQDIVEDYEDQGYVLTVRQLYYQLVARDIIANTLQEYKRVASIINDAKHAGMLDWDMIEDRTRAFVRVASWSTPGSILRSAAESFHMDLWEYQIYRVFVVIEKEALVGVLQQTCREHDVPILAARGYPSGSVLREFAETDLIPAINRGQIPIILHLGDHDPSGLDMTRDLQSRLTMYAGEDVELKRIGLNMDQVEELRPPENPAKASDSRFVEYQREFGDSSWELDALPPSYLNDLVAAQMSSYIEPTEFARNREKIQKAREQLVLLANTHKFF